VTRARVAENGDAASRPGLAPGGGPAWSAGTLRALAALPPAHEAFVRAYVTGLSAAAALRLATGRTTVLDRQSAYHLKARPTVAAALYQCLADPGYAAWMRGRIAAAQAAARAPDRVAHPAGRIGNGGPGHGGRGRRTDGRRR
jgi:hypothetical protein